MIKISLSTIMCLCLAGKFSQQNKWDHAEWKIPNNLLVLINDGECCFKIDKRNIYLQKDDIIIVPKNTFYAPEVTNSCAYSYFHFNADIATGDFVQTPCKAYSFCENIHEDCPDILIPETVHCDENIKNILNTALTDMTGTAPQSNFKMNIEFINALICLSALSYESTESLPVYNIKNYIDNNFREKLTLTGISKKFGYTKQYIIRLFNEQFNTTPTKYINDCRLRNSVNYIVNTGMCICEISWKCGFEDENYFCRIFKKKYGFSPTQYRKRLIGM